MLMPLALADSLCLSAFARVATRPFQLPSCCRSLCLSAFARVATAVYSSLPIPQFFATAHSRGLRLWAKNKYITQKTLPQRIRAGCDFKRLHEYQYMSLCHSAFARVTTYHPFRLQTDTDLCHSAFARVTTAEKQCSALRICCEKVDSFSSVGESGLALTIFPFSFAAKATYVAINDSFGRAIDRFFGANRTGISVNYDFAEHPCL